MTKISLFIVEQRWTEKKKRWRELLPAWYSFWVDEPLNSAALGSLEEGSNKLNLTHKLQDMMDYDTLPLVVSWDTENKKVGTIVHYPS